MTFKKASLIACTVLVPSISFCMPPKSASRPRVKQLDVVSVDLEQARNIFLKAIEMCARDCDDIVSQIGRAESDKMATEIECIKISAKISKNYVEAVRGGAKQLVDDMVAVLDTLCGERNRLKQILSEKKGKASLWPKK